MGHDGILIKIYTDKIWENPTCIYIYTHLYLFIYLSICLSIYLPIYLSLSLSFLSPWIFIRKYMVVYWKVLHQFSESPPFVWKRSNGNLVSWGEWREDSLSPHQAPTSHPQPILIMYLAWLPIYLWFLQVYMIFHGLTLHSLAQVYISTMCRYIQMQDFNKTACMQIEQYTQAKTISAKYWPMHKLKINCDIYIYSYIQYVCICMRRHVHKCVLKTNINIYI
jgi:hypothetical protein